MTVYCIAILFGISAIGIGYYALTAITAGLRSYSETYSQNTAKQFEDIFLFIPSRRIMEISWILAIIVFVIIFILLSNFRSAGGILLGLVPAALGGYLALSSPQYLFNMLKKRRIKKFNIQLVDALLSMSNALKAGFSIMQAFEAVAKENNPPISQEFDLFLQQTRLGIPFSEALAKLEERVGSEDFSLVAGAIETARKTGGNLMEVFEKISETIRERMRIETRIMTLTAQGRLQGIIVSLMPVIIALVLFILDPVMMKSFFGSVLGLILTLTTVVLIIIGGFVIRKIIKIDI